MSQHRQVAGYARVSSDRQARDGTIASQISAIQERIAGDKATLLPGWLFADDGYSGETLERPALEALRDKVAAGEVDRLYLHSPDRLARRYAYQVLLLEEFARAGVEVVFLNHQPESSPEGELLVQVQGVIAEYERAKILERMRRGRKHRARSGDVAVLNRAPFGYIYREKKKYGAASYELHPQQSQTVRQIFRWYVRDGLPMSRIARQLNSQKTPTQTGVCLWGARTVWRVLTHPAYMGKAYFGKTRKVPRTAPRLRPLRGTPEHPRARLIPRPTDPAERIEIAVPAMVSAEEFDLAREKLEENRKRFRSGPQGPRYLLQGLLVCGHCGHAVIHQPGGPAGYYRCTGCNSHRYGGVRVCHARGVRADALEQTVWRDAGALLTEPARLRGYFQERGRADPEAAQTRDLGVKLLKRQEQGLERLIDIYTQGAISKEQFEARARRLRQHIKAQHEELQHAQDQEAARTAMHAACESFELFAQSIHAGIQVEDLATRIRILRLLIKEITIRDPEIQITYKISPTPPNPFEPAPNGGSLQHCSSRYTDTRVTILVFDVGSGSTSP